MAGFEYQPLETGEIRLLRIKKAPNVKKYPLGGGRLSKSGPLYAPIECEIATYSLRDCPPFTALSYTWGADKSQRDIKLNGLPKTVQPNLSRFLRHARDDLNFYPDGSSSSRRQPKPGETTYFFPPEMLWEAMAPQPPGAALGVSTTASLQVAAQYMTPDPCPWPKSEAKTEIIQTPQPESKSGKSKRFEILKKIGFRSASQTPPNEATNSSIYSPVGYLWIDALCINQESVSERNAQVAIMRDIYKAAKRIVVWLGLGCACHRDYPYLATEAYRLYGESSRNGVLDSCTGTEIPEHVVDAIRCLGENEWWSRSWILQEASTPHAALELWLGPSRVSFEDIKFVHYDMLWAMGMERQAAIPPGYNKTLDLLGELAESRLDGDGLTLLYFLIKCQNFEATNPRDKIYAFLGIYADACGDFPITIDYSLSVAEVFKNTAIHILQQDLKPTILAFCCSSRNEVLSPSWVPDFSVSGDHQVAIRPTTTTNSSFGSPIRFENNMNHLVVNGAIFDRVTEIVPPLLTADAKIPDDEIADFALNSPAFLAWFTAIAELAYPDGVEVEYPGGARTTAALSLLFMGMKDTPDPVHNSVVEPPFLQVLQGGNFVNPVYRTPVVIAMIQQKYPCLAFFKTKKGYLGFGDENTRVWDAIVEVDGLSVPLVLRSNGATWRLLGPSFVVGIMSGENRMIEKETVFKIE
jgi:hypothetical protein